MPEGQQTGQGGFVYNRSGLNRAPGAPVAGITDLINNKYNLHTSSRIARELLDTGSC